MSKVTFNTVVEGGIYRAAYGGFKGRLFRANRKYEPMGTSPGLVEMQIWDPKQERWFDFTSIPENSEQEWRLLAPVTLASSFRRVGPNRVNMAIPNVYLDVAEHNEGFEYWDRLTPEQVVADINTFLNNGGWTHV